MMTLKFEILNQIPRIWKLLSFMHINKKVTTTQYSFQTILAVKIYILFSKLDNSPFDT